MEGIVEALVENFHNWERRGRGADLFPAPVHLEPSFAPFPGHRLNIGAAGSDSGARPTFLSRLAEKVFRSLQPPVSAASAIQTIDPPEDEGPDFLEDDEPLTELRLLLPADFSSGAEDMRPFLTSLAHLDGPLAFELTATSGELSVQLVVYESDVETVEAQLRGHFPEILVQPLEGHLSEIWREDGDDDQMVIEFSLGREFMWPLASGHRADPFVGLLNAMAELGDGEAAVYQILFTPLSAPWDEEALRAVTGDCGKPFFDDGADLLNAARRKVSAPLFGCVVRLAVQSTEFDRMWRLLRDMAAPLRLFADRSGNHLEPLRNDGYDHAEHSRDLLLRRSRRSGMILNLEEVVGFAHFPSGAVRIPKLRRISGRTREAPAPPLDGHSLFLGLNSHGGRSNEVWLTREQRVRHIHILGSTGTGKSTLLLEMMRQDLARGRGFALLDPHGDLADRVLGEVPADRIEDVVVLDPSDEDYCVPFNILSARSESEKTLLSSDLVGVFQRLSTSWGDQMNSVLRNAVLAFLESSEGGTLSDLRRFLLEPKWRARFLATVPDPDLVYYWTQAFPQLGSNKSIGPIITRLDTFLSPKPLRRMVSRKENRVDFGEIMDSGKILLARLPQGQMGAENSFLMGCLIVAKIQQMTMSRQRLEAAGRRDFFCYIDEAHHFLTPSMREILSGARKYRMGLVLAHQELRQLERDKEVAAAVSNAGTRIVFRVGDSDARALAEGFAHFGAEDIQRLQTGEALCRVEGAHHDFNLEVSPSEQSDSDEARRRRTEVIEASRRTYAIPRSDFESEPSSSLLTEVPPPPPPPVNEVAPPVPEAIPRELEIPVTENPPSDVVTVPEPPSPSPPVEAKTLPDPPTPDSAEQVQGVELPDSAGPVHDDEPPEIPKSPAPFGRGGPTHSALQRQVVDAANAAGFKAFPECDILAGRHRLDVSVEGSGFKAAFEIVVTSRLRKETEALLACFESGYECAFLVCTDAEKLSAASAVTGDVLADHDVRCILPVQIPSTLKSLVRKAEQPPAPVSEVERFANHDITRTAPKLTPAERRRREHEMLKLIAEAIRGDAPPK